MKYKAIVMGASSGGMNALKTILPAFPGNFSLPVIVVQHIGAASESYWIESFGNICRMKVKEADEKERIEAGNIYIAPPNYHLLVERDETFSLSIEGRVNFARPSIDVLFESAAVVYRNGLIGVLLTGANSDGALGMKKIKECGGITLVQNPLTAEAAVMPASAVEAGAADHILSLENIISLLKELAF